MHFQDYDRVRLYTHGRTRTSFGDEYEIGHADDLICMAIAAQNGWTAIRLDDVSPSYVRGRLGRDSYVLNIIADFQYTPESWESNVIVFDHHDPSSPTDKCSAHLLMEELVKQGLMEKVPPLMEQVSKWDVIGPQAVPIDDRPDPDRYTAVLAAEPEDGFDRETAEFILDLLEKSSTIKDFIEELFRSETPFGKTARIIHSEIQSKREEALAGIVESATVKTSPSGIKYAVLQDNPAGMLRELFSRLGVDIVIHPNERTRGALSVVRDSDGKYATNPVAELVQVDPGQVVFVHPGGFLLVAHPPVVVK